jgi:hypothetical protein
MNFTDGAQLMLRIDLCVDSLQLSLGFQNPQELP